MNQQNGQSIAQNTEIELKLKVEPEKALRLFDLPVLLNLTEGDPTTHDLVSTYYDTKGYALLKAGMTLRIRDKEGELCQTLKTSGRVTNGLHQRGEWEAALEDNKFDLDKVSEPALRDQLRSITEIASLVPVFNTRFSRTAIHCLIDEETIIEVCLDQGEIESSKAVIPLTEIEIELIKGNKIHSLFQVAHEISLNIPVALDLHSKAWQGYRLHQLVNAGKPAPKLEKIVPVAAEFFLAEAEKYFKQYKAH